MQVAPIDVPVQIGTSVLTMIQILLVRIQKDTYVTVGFSKYISVHPGRLYRNVPRDTGSVCSFILLHNAYTVTLIT